MLSLSVDGFDPKCEALDAVDTHALARIGSGQTAVKVHHPRSRSFLPSPVGAAHDSVLEIAMFRVSITVTTLFPSEHDRWTSDPLPLGPPAAWPQGRARTARVLPSLDAVSASGICLVRGIRAGLPHAPFGSLNPRAAIEHVAALIPTA